MPVGSSPIDESAVQVQTSTVNPWALGINVSTNTLYTCPSTDSLSGAANIAAASIWSYSITLSTIDTVMPSTGFHGSSASLWATSYSLIQQGLAVTQTGTLYLIVQPTADAITRVIDAAGTGGANLERPLFSSLSISVCDVQPVPSSATTLLNTTAPLAEIYAKCGILTHSPTPVPTEAPTREPTASPTTYPSAAPTDAPSDTPTTNPTLYPTNPPTIPPTFAPTLDPTVSFAPTAQPTTSLFYGPMTANECAQQMAWVQLGSDLDVELVGDTPVNSQYGYAVDLSSDGTYVVVGIPATDGGFRVYQLSGGSWGQVGADVTGGTGYAMGAAIAISADGTVVAVGSPHADTNTGRASVYGYSGGSWTQHGSDLTGAATNNLFGGAISMDREGNNIIAVGANGFSTNTGQVIMYTCPSGGCTQYGNKLTGDAVNEEFGYAVSLSSSGDTVAVGIPFNDDGGADAGAVKVYTISGSTWSQTGSTITGTSPESMGIAVSLAPNGSLVACGNFDGDVEVYELVGSTWTQLGSTIVPDVSGIPFIDWAGDGSVLATSTSTSNGHVSVWRWTGTEWRQNGVTLVGPASSTNIGYYVALDNNGLTLAIGAEQGADDTVAGLAQVLQQNTNDDSGWADRYADAAETIIVRRYCCAKYARKYKHPLLYPCLLTWID